MKAQEEINIGTVIDLRDAEKVVVREWYVVDFSVKTFNSPEKTFGPSSDYYMLENKTEMVEAISFADAVGIKETQLKKELGVDTKILSIKAKKHND